MFIWKATIYHQSTMVLTMKFKKKWCLEYSIWLYWEDLAAIRVNSEEFSEKNLYYMKLMYLLYRELFEKFPQDVGKINNHDLFNPNDLFSISWSHHRYIIDKCKKDTNKALFYVRKTLENNWSRSVLLNFLDTDIL